MARIYAGILGLLAFLTSLAHGVVHARQVESIVLAAWWSMLAFAVFGSIIGWIAERIIEESVSAVVARQLATERAPGKVDTSALSTAEK